MNTLKNILIAAAIGGATLGALALVAFTVVMVVVHAFNNFDAGTLFAAIAWLVLSVCVYNIRKELEGHRQ